MKEHGTYALTLSCHCEAIIEVGRLGNLQVEPGWYIYIGSAFGTGGLQARLHHHLRSTAAPRWHLDYTRGHLTAREIWYSTDPDPLEHVWAQACLRLAGASVPLARFGASDCHCPSHFFHLIHQPELEKFIAILRDRGCCEERLALLKFDENSYPKSLDSLSGVC